MLTRKNYETIARIVRNIVDRSQRFATANEFAQYLQDDNPRFDEQKFRKACEAIRTEKDNDDEN